MNKKIVIVGAGVAGINAATKLVDNGYPGELITIIDAGKDPYLRPKEEVMKGFAGAGLFSDGKWSYLHNAVGGQLAKYMGEGKAEQVLEEAWQYILRFHPDPSKVMFSQPTEEPDFIKPYFNLRMAPAYHVGTNYLHDMGKRWYDWLVEKGINFIWEKEVEDIDFEKQWVLINNATLLRVYFDKLIYGTGKSGIDLTQKLIDKYNLKKEPKSVQLGVRMELPQKYMQPIVDIAYDFKLYKRHNDKVSSRSFCSNNFAAYVAEEVTYNMKSYNGHSYKQDNMVNNMTNFGIIMEIKNINNPFQFQKDIVSKCQIDGKGIHYSPNFTRKPSLTAEGKEMNVVSVGDLNLFKEIYKEYADYIINYIEDLNKVFKFENDYSLYIPEVKFLSEEVLVNYEDLSLVDYPNIHFVGDSLSSRGIAVSAAQGVYSVKTILGDWKKDQYLMEQGTGDLFN
jgi:uncharacterized FAD-dependent dehydrogenase